MIGDGFTAGAAGRARAAAQILMERAWPGIHPAATRADKAPRTIDAGRSGRGGGNGGGWGGLPGPLKDLFDGGIVRWVVAAVVLLVLFSSFQLIGEQQRGVVLRFGQFSRILQPGPNFKLPWPIDRSPRSTPPRSRPSRSRCRC
jgi:hypothetical protein